MLVKREEVYLESIILAYYGHRSQGGLAVQGGLDMVLGCLLEHDVSRSLVPVIRARFLYSS
jgi:hypothetical protein